MEKLPRRERQVLDTLFAIGEGSVEEIRAAMSDPPSNSAVRAMLVRMEAKGSVKHRIDGQRYIYAPAIAKQSARRHALRHLVQSFFDGSAASAATALLGMAEHLDEEELQRLEDLIRAARQQPR